MPVVARRHAGAGIVGKARRTVADVGHRRDDVRRGVALACVPEAFGIPRAHLGQPLPADGPSVVRPLQHQCPAGLVTAVAVVVTSPKIALVVEAQLLRIAQALGEKFEVRPIRLAAKHGAAVGQLNHASLAIGHRGPAIRDREVDAAVGSLGQAVEIVSAKRHVDSKTMQQPVPRGRRRRSFRIGGGESPQIRNAGEPHIRPLRQHACRHSAHASLKAVRKGHGLVGMARLGAVPNQLNPLRLHLEVATIDHPVVIEIRKGTGPRRRGSSEEGAVRRQHPTEELLAFLHRTQREIVLHPVLEIADVEHAGAPAARLHHIGATKRVEAKAGDVLHQRLAGPERHLKSGSHLQWRLRRRGVG